MFVLLTFLGIRFDKILTRSFAYLPPLPPPHALNPNSQFQYLSVVVAFNRSKPYRRSMVTNVVFFTRSCCAYKFACVVLADMSCSQISGVVLEACGAA